MPEYFQTGDIVVVGPSPANPVMPMINMMAGAVSNPVRVVYIHPIEGEVNGHKIVVRWEAPGLP